MTEPYFPVADDLVRNNQSHAARIGSRDIGAAPGLQVAVVTCMDSRIDVFSMLGLAAGDAHVIRNAGGVVTDDVLRSLTLSQRKLGTREIVLVHHSKCGLQDLDEDEFRAELAEATGAEPTWENLAFEDTATSVKASAQRVRDSPFVPHTDHIRGFVYDVDIGLLREVELS